MPATFSTTPAVQKKISSELSRWFETKRGKPAIIYIQPAWEDPLTPQSGERNSALASALEKNLQAILGAEPEWLDALRAYAAPASGEQVQRIARLKEVLCVELAGDQRKAGV